MIPFDQGNTSVLSALHENLLHATPFDDAAGLFVFVTGVAALQLDMMGITAMGDELMQRCHDAAMTSSDVQLHAQYQNRKGMRIVASGTGNHGMPGKTPLLPENFFRPSEVAEWMP